MLAGHDVSSQTFNTFSPPRKHFSRGLAALKRGMKNYTKYALAKSTQRVYKVGCKKYIKFCKMHQCSPLPPKQSTLCLFMTFLAQSVACKTIKLYLCALKHYSVSHGYKNPVPTMHRFHILLQGIKRKLGAVGKRKPRFLITIHNLKQIRRYTTLNYPNKTDQTMLWAASTLAFFAFLRSSEYTAPTSRKYKKNCTLQQKNITILDTRMLVQIKGSKTEPFREG